MLQTLLSTLTGRASSLGWWRAALVLLLCVITWLALTPAPPRQADLGWDKLNDLAAFATLAVVAMLGRSGSYGRVGAALLAYGALIEVLQSYTPTRAGEWADLLADGLGIALGMLLVAIWLRLATATGKA
jgi:VanZ family protein